MKNGRWAYPYGSTSKCTKPSKILWSQMGALGSMNHMAVKRQSATKQIRKTEEGKTADGLTPMDQRLPCNSIPFRIHFWSHEQCSGSIGFLVQCKECRWALTLKRKHEKTFGSACNLLFGVMCWGNLMFLSMLIMLEVGPHQIAKKTYVS